MRLLMIAPGYPPYLFSENLCNGKLVLALMRAGVEVDVVSKVDEGLSYSADWSAPWDMLRPSAHIINYKTGGKIQRAIDIAFSGIYMGWNFKPGVRWMRRATEMGLKLIDKNHYDAILTRSPNDMAHFVGEKLKKETEIKWVANWNDPATPIWPGQYKHNLSADEQLRSMEETARLLRFADINTFPSDSLRQHFTVNFPFLRQTPTYVLPHIGLCSDLWPVGIPNSADGKIRLLHSGNLSTERNPETTFCALRRLADEGFHDIEFHIMGHINDYTAQLVERYRLGEIVKCIGSYPYMEALARMQAYDVLVLLEARLEKGIFFASKFTDYLQTGLPIFAISPKEGFASDMLAGKEGEFLADNEDVDSILSALRAIISRKKSGELMRCASSELFRKVAPAAVVAEYIEMVQNG